jgi:hypothetical protein
MKYRLPTIFILMSAFLLHDLIAFCLAVGASAPNAIAAGMVLPPIGPHPDMPEQFVVPPGLPAESPAANLPPIASAAVAPDGLVPVATPPFQALVRDIPLQCNALPLPSQVALLPMLGTSLLKIAPFGTSTAGSPTALLADLASIRSCAIALRRWDARRPLIGLSPAVLVPPG